MNKFEPVTKFKIEWVYPGQNRTAILTADYSSFHAAKKEADFLLNETAGKFSGTYNIYEIVTTLMWPLS